MWGEERVIKQFPDESAVHTNPVWVVGSVLAVFARSATFGKNAIPKATQSNKPNSAEIPLNRLIFIGIKINPAK
tara:strand:- start:15226 stop:15447 length:222 start_codon:yes stop_codon:yes gene_type:complete